MHGFCVLAKKIILKEIEQNRGNNKNMENLLGIGVNLLVKNK